VRAVLDGTAAAAVIDGLREGADGPTLRSRLGLTEEEYSRELAAIHAEKLRVIRAWRAYEGLPRHARPPVKLSAADRRIARTIRRLAARADRMPFRVLLLRLHVPVSQVLDVLIRLGEEKKPPRSRK
jgi:hypothetical protein